MRKGMLVSIVMFLVLVSNVSKSLANTSAPGGKGFVLEKVLSPPYAPFGKFTYVDLKSKANQKLTQQMHNVSGNNLKELPQGEQTLGDVKFNISDAMIHLGSRRLSSKPLMVRGIMINQSFSRLFILHGASWGNQSFDGTNIGHYKVHYRGGTSEIIPLEYGKHVRDWWDNDNSKAVSHGMIVWKGSSSAATKGNTTLRLYMCGWKNPYPNKTVVSIDFISANITTAPFCIAMTLEDANYHFGNKAFKMIWISVISGVVLFSVCLLVIRIFHLMDKN